MFNVTIIKLKDIAKIIAIVVIIYIISRIFIKNDSIINYLNQSFLNFNTSDFVELGINTESTIIKTLSKEDNTLSEEKSEEISFEAILQIASNAFTAKETEEFNSVIAETENNTDIDTEAETISTDVETEVVTQNPIAESYNVEYNGVKIKNETSYQLTDEILNTDSLDINTENIIIFHTHTCESYTQSENYQYTSTGNYRTTDLNYTVARVGDELTNYLTSYGFNVNHDKTYHDYPSYSGSYTRSLATVQNILQSFSSDIIIDLHRDAIGSDETYAPLVKIGDDYCAQLMFVIGTDGGGLSHPNWNSNLQFAIKLQEKANELYPGLFKPIVLRNSRYNQHLGKAACIIEVGATGNTMEQTLASMKYLAIIMNELF